MSLQLHPSDNVQTPDLRIMPLDALVEHEYNDAQRTAPLSLRIESEGLLKNPPIVTPLYDCASPTAPPKCYVVLDGANRSAALQYLGYPHVLVQVVPYEPPTVTLTTWHHLVTRLDPAQFTSALGTVPGIDLFETNLLEARAGLSRREYLLYVIRSDGCIFAAWAKPTGLPQGSDPGGASKGSAVHMQNRLLNALVDTYKDAGGLHRAMADDLEEAHRLYADLTALVIFPNYTPDEVLALARDGELLPTGLTRHLIQGRALRLNYPLSELKSAEPLEAKNARLQEWLRKKLASKEVRFYGEMTFLFDE